MLVRFARHHRFRFRIHGRSHTGAEQGELEEVVAEPKDRPAAQAVAPAPLPGSDDPLVDEVLPVRVMCVCGAFCLGPIHPFCLPVFWNADAPHVPHPRQPLESAQDRLPDLVDQPLLRPASGWLVGWLCEPSGEKGMDASARTMYTTDSRTYRSSSSSPPSSAPRMGQGTSTMMASWPGGHTVGSVLCPHQSAHTHNIFR